MSEHTLAVNRLWVLPHTEPMSPPTAGMLQQQLDDLSEQVDDGHKRLRNEVDQLADRLTGFAVTLESYRAEVKSFRSTPTNITNISFSANQLVAIVLATLAVAGGFYTMAERQSETNSAIERMQKNQELQRIQIESLTKTVLTQGRDR